MGSTANSVVVEELTKKINELNQKQQEYAQNQEILSRKHDTLLQKHDALLLTVAENHKKPSEEYLRVMSEVFSQILENNNKSHVHRDLPPGFGGVLGSSPGFSTNTHDRQHRTTFPGEGSHSHRAVDGINEGNFHQPKPKVDFPRFDGQKPRCWIRNCRIFFHIHPMDDEQKANLASLYLDGKADVWFQDYQSCKPMEVW